MTYFPNNNPSNIIGLLALKRVNLKKEACIRYRKNIKPDLKPKINYLSIDTLPVRSYAIVYIYGENFFPNGATTIEFGNVNVNSNFISSNTIFFEVPFIVFPGIYNIIVKNNISLKAINVTGISNSVISISNKVPFLMTE
jgi:hypothetical protein